MSQHGASLSLLLAAHAKAINRFMTGGDRPRHLIPQAMRALEDPELHNPMDDRVTAADLYSTLNEALRAGRALDRRIGEVDGGPNWWKHADYPEAVLVPGLRFARNAAEHDGAELIGFPHGTPRLSGRAIVGETIWRDVEASRSTGQATYRDRLVGESILVTLSAMGAVYSAAFYDLVRRGLIEREEGAEVVQIRDDAP